MKKVIVAVDAGGTKTKICFLDEANKIVYETIKGCGSPAVLQEKAIDNICLWLKEVLKDALKQYEICGIVLGISGFSVVKDKAQFIKQLQDEYKVPVVANNDAILALYSIIQDKYNEGILVLVGTGSAVLGIKNGKTILMNSWGHLLTEKGSSYVIVRDVICDAINHWEESGEILQLGKLLMQKMKLNSLDEVKTYFYNHTKDEIASYAKFLGDLANLEKNVEAQKIFAKAAKDLASAVYNVFKALNLSHNAILAFRGGIITGNAFFKQELITQLDNYEINMQLSLENIDPIYGAFYLAKKENMFNRGVNYE